MDNNKDVVIEAAGAGTDLVMASIGYTLGANVEYLTLTGSAAINGTGNDLSNMITGNGAGNFLMGGLGADTLTGGLGADIFAYTSVSESGVATGTWDVITDFSSAQGDKIDLSKIDANPLKKGDQAFTFIGSAAFSSTDATAQLMFDPATHMLYGSIDANASPEIAILLTGVTTLAPTDLVL